MHRLLPAMTEFTFDRQVFTARVKLGVSSSGRPVPTITLTASKRVEYRKLNALLHAVAAVAECHTPPGERWIVQFERLGDMVGRVELELLHATPAEAARGMRLLEHVAALTLSPEGVRLRVST